MSILAASLIAGLTLLAGVVLAQLSLRRARRRRLAGLELKPNCLLTRHPIALISGRRSLFRLFDHWNNVPSFLREHGYEVLILEPAPKDRERSLLAALSDLPEKCHLIADTSSESELKAIAELNSDKIASLTMIRQPARDAVKRSARPSLADFKPLSRAIETFDIDTDVRVRASLSNVASRTLLGLHNALAAKGERRVRALETATLETSEPWQTEARFLDLAVALAERDVTWG